MSIAYVGGAYVDLRLAAVSILDRGFQFGDAIYEVWSVRDGRLRDVEGHLARLARSLNETRIVRPLTDRALLLVLEEVRRRNRVRDGLVYLQISRGAAARDHAFPSPAVRPTVVITAKSLRRDLAEQRAASGVSVITTPEQRWARCDIKSVNLLPNVLARQHAREAGAAEAWFVDADGCITEGTSSNAWIVDADGRLRTHPLTNRILHGVTRAAMMDAAARLGVAVAELAFTRAEALAAREAFITGATNPATPVVAIDGAPIGEGRPGPIASSLRRAYFAAPASQS